MNVLFRSSVYELHKKKALAYVYVIRIVLTVCTLDSLCIYRGNDMNKYFIIKIVNTCYYSSRLSELNLLEVSVSLYYHIIRNNVVKLNKVQVFLQVTLYFFIFFCDKISLLHA